MGERQKYAVFTMDVEELYDTGCIAARGLHPEDDVLDGLDKYIELLEKHGIRATLFTLATTAKRIEEKIRKYSKRGHRVALHGYDHNSLDKFTPEEFRKRVITAKKYLESITGERVEGYRAPFFSMDDEKIDVLKDLGFAYDSSSQVFEKNYLRGAFTMEGFEKISEGVAKNGDIFEFSLPCENILGCKYPVSGGGYDRICPWFFVKYGVKRYIKKNDTYVFYLHPFEISDNRCSDLTGLPKNERFYMSYGISSYAKRIECIIEMLKKEGYSFVTFEELCKIMTPKESVSI